MSEVRLVQCGIVLREWDASTGIFGRIAYGTGWPRIWPGPRWWTRASTIRVRIVP